MSSKARQERAEQRFAAQDRVCQCGRPLGRGLVGRHADGSPSCEADFRYLLSAPTQAPRYGQAA
jgi:hypothetical protein